MEDAPEVPDPALPGSVVAQHGRPADWRGDLLEVKLFVRAGFEAPTFWLISLQHCVFTG
jgi:hypothetical protein